MNKQEINRVLYISIALSACLTLVYMLISQNVELKTFYRGVSVSITVVTFFWTFYFAYGWRMFLLEKIFYRPNLNGTWKGQLISDWKNEKGETTPPKDIFIVIRQNFLRIHFTTFTDTFVGYSYAETFNLEKETGLKNVAYLYRKDTSQSNDEELREGAAELRLIITESSKKLDGKYWTNTKTQGKISVEFIKEIQVDSFDCGRKII